MRPINQSCFWMASHPYSAEQELRGNSAADIAIVGAGFTGLWTALFLKELEPQTDVAILEKRVAGYGGSGRNAGIISDTIDHSHSLAIKHFGFQEAAKLAALGQRNLDEIAAFLSANSIDCEYEPTGRLHVALTYRQVEEARRSIETAQELGITNLRFFGAQEMQDEIHCPLYLGGVFAPSGGVLNPMKLVDGLKRVALHGGVRIFEQTAVTGIENGRLRTPGGSITAQRVIVATDAYTHHLLPGLLKRFIPLYDYILVSEPLTRDQLTAIGWRNRQGVTDGRTFFNYYRLTKDNRILWGTSEAKYYSRNRVEEACDHSEQHYAALQESFRRHFPQLSGLEFPYSWGGPIASTTRLTPFFGSLEKGRILYGLGYTGHGIASSRLGGKILGHLALERPCELLDLSLARKKPFPFPPEPLRSLGVRLVTDSLRKVDTGGKPNLLLHLMDRLKIGFSS